MRNMALLIAPALLSASAGIAAQPAASAHDQHQVAGQQQGKELHQAKPGGMECCCEKMMHEMHQMMTEMHKMHQGVNAHSEHRDKPQQPKP